MPLLPVLALEPNALWLLLLAPKPEALLLLLDPNPPKPEDCWLLLWPNPPKPPLPKDIPGNDNYREEFDTAGEDIDANFCERWEISIRG